MSWILICLVGGALLTQLGRALSHASEPGAPQHAAPKTATLATCAPATATTVEPRPAPDPVGDVRHHLVHAWIQGACGAPLLVFGLALMTTPNDTLGVVAVLCGGSLLLVAVGRIWAIGGLSTRRWAGAAVSIWRVEEAEDNEDCDGFCTWFHVQLIAVDIGNADPSRTTLGTPVRFFPATPDTKSGWLHREVRVLEARDGTAVIGLVGHRYYRMGMASPWDFLDDWLGWQGEPRRSKETSRSRSSDAWPRGPLW